MLRAILFLITSVLAVAQNSASIIQYLWPPETVLYFRDGSNNEQYVCTALATQPTYQWTGASMITSIVDSGTTSTITFVSAHGLAVGNKITISGMTSSGTSALNATFNVATVGSSTTLTVTTSGVTDGTYTPSSDPSMAIQTTAPRSSAAIWQIYRIFYTSTYRDRKAWADGTSDPSKVCDSKATYAYN